MAPQRIAPVLSEISIRWRFSQRFPCSAENNSLLALENFLFGCVGNLGVSRWHIIGKPSRLLAFGAKSGKFPCIFPVCTENFIRID